MPVPVPSAEPVDLPLFPRSTKESIDAARLSSWFPLFRRVTIPSTVIDLDEIGEKEAFLDVSWSSLAYYNTVDDGSSGLTRTRYSYQLNVIRQSFKPSLRTIG